MLVRMPLVSLWIAVFTLLAASQGRTTTFLERPFAASVQDAPVIVHGTIGNTYVDWGHEQGGSKRIFTFWELRVTEVLKGDADRGLLRMREMGGEKDGVGMQVAGTATFDPGEDVVVFLSEKNSEGSYDVWGMSMGKYMLQKDSGGGEYLVGAGINSLTRPRLGDGEGDGGKKPKWTLEALRRLIASQGGSPKAPVASTPTPVVSPAPDAVSETESSPAAAPGLQPSEPESPFPVAWVLAGLAAAILVAVFLKTRR